MYTSSSFHTNHIFICIQPKTYIPGQHGESRSLVLELKIIADVGLVGFPNVRLKLSFISYICVFELDFVRVYDLK